MVGHETDPAQHPQGATGRCSKHKKDESRSAMGTLCLSRLLVGGECGGPGGGV